jgi:hypothetical protein
VSQFYSIDTAFSADRAMMYRKRDCIPLAKRDNLRPRLHSRPLLRQDELAAREIHFRFRQQYGDLNWKHMFAVQILMQAVVVANSVPQQQRRRSRLSSGVTTLEELSQSLGILDMDPHGLIPAICEGD